MQKLRSVDEGLASRIDEGLGDSEGFLRVLVTGSPAPMSRALLAAIHERADELFSARRGRKPAVLGDIVKLLGGSEILVADFINCVKQLQSALTKAGYSGIVIVIDELGKFLEYEARHYGANDIFLLQALAEHACAGSDCNLLLFVTLHQSFEQRRQRSIGRHRACGCRRATLGFGCQRGSCLVCKLLSPEPCFSPSAPTLVPKGSAERENAIQLFGSPRGARPAGRVKSL